MFLPRRSCLLCVGPVRPVPSAQSATQSHGDTKCPFAEGNCLIGRFLSLDAAVLVEFCRCCEESLLRCHLLPPGVSCAQEGTRLAAISNITHLSGGLLKDSKCPYRRVMSTLNEWKQHISELGCCTKNGSIAFCIFV